MNKKQYTVNQIARRINNMLRPVVKLTLAQITRKIDNIIANHLLTFSLGTHIGDMTLSLETHQLITERNRVTHQLRASLKADRRVYMKAAAAAAAKAEKNRA